VRLRAGRNADLVGAQFPLVDLCGVGPGEDCPAADHFHLVAGKCLGVQAAESRHFGQHVVAQRRPIEGGVRDGPAEAPRVDQVLREVCAVHQQFLGHAATDHARAADAVLLDDRHPGAVRSRDAGRPDATRARANDEQVVLMLPRHGGAHPICRILREITRWPVQPLDAPVSRS
jgi:hypothetical protein